MTVEKSPEAMGGEKRSTRVPRLMTVALAPAAIWFVYLLILYGLGVAACKTALGPWPMHVVSLFSVAGILIAGRAGWRHLQWREAAEPWHSPASGAPEDPGAAELERTRFLALIAIASSPFFAVIALGQWLSTLVFSPCLA